MVWRAWVINVGQIQPVFASLDCFGANPPFTILQPAQCTPGSFLKNSCGTILRARASIFWILRQSVDLLTPTKFQSHPPTRSRLTLSSSGTSHADDGGSTRVGPFMSNYFVEPSYELGPQSLAFCVKVSSY